MARRFGNNLSLSVFGGQLGVSLSLCAGAAHSVLLRRGLPHASNFKGMAEGVNSMHGHKFRVDMNNILVSGGSFA